ncbi:ribosome maturation factor RimM [Georgenia wangjunii]|uniref:ribosome maturation factor RimM n=1 Tax=Georgenia wangjunii TaxID=3117730 RepID=UPI002F266D3D
MELIVARIGAPRGLRGMVRLELRTDAPQERFTTGAVLVTDPRDRGPLTVAEVANQGGHWHVRFAEAADRTAAEALRGTALVVDTDSDDAADDDDAWYPHELVGLRVEHVDGRVLGTVAAVEHPPAHDVLVVTEAGGERSMVPFVSQIVPVVDVAGGRVVVDPPRGLLASDPLPADDATPDAGARVRGDESTGEGA